MKCDGPRPALIGAVLVVVLAAALHEQWRPLLEESPEVVEKTYHPTPPSSDPYHLLEGQKDYLLDDGFSTVRVTANGALHVDCVSGCGDTGGGSSASFSTGLD